MGSPSGGVSRFLQLAAHRRLLPVPRVVVQPASQLLDLVQHVRPQLGALQTMVSAGRHSPSSASIIVTACRAISQRGQEVVSRRVAA